MLDKRGDNAAEVCRSKGNVGIKLSRVRRGWRILFSNDGPLLPDQLKEQIFDSLVSVRKDQGQTIHLGLGLHIVRLIVRAHGGRISARNRADGSGVELLLNIFGVRSPAGQGAEQPAQR